MMAPAAFANIAAASSVYHLLVEVNRDSIGAVIAMHFGDDFGANTSGVKKGINIALGFVAWLPRPITSHRGLEHFTRCVLHGV